MPSTPDTNDALLTVQGLSLAIRRGRAHTPAVAGLDFSLRAGETLALVGESGCGKSLTAQALMRLLPPAIRVTAGQVRFQGRELLNLPEADMRELRGRGMGMIFQEPATSLNPVLTVGQQIGEVLVRHLGLQGRAVRERAEALLQQVGIADPARRLDEYPFQLSGGMKQRVMIAMALAGEPSLLIADEPTTALDVTVQSQILDLLQELQARRGMALLLITHDLGVVARMAHRVGVMYAGQLVELASRDAFFQEARHPYSRALFAALPEAVPRGARLQALAGQVPAFAAMPKACRFAERCDRVQPLCREQAPLLTPLAGNPENQVRCHFPGSGSFLAAAAGPGAGSPTFGPALLEVSGLQVYFPIRKGILQRVRGQVRAVDGVSLELAPGRTLALVGESGCGKTTVGKALMQLLPLTAGSVRWQGQALAGQGGKDRSWRRRMQMVFQDPFASLNPRMTVGDILLEGMQALGVVKDAAAGRAASAALLEQVGLQGDSLDRYPHEFSGGQRQRIAIARALAVSPQVLICDEPTSALDVSVQAQILNLLKDLQERLQMAYLFITHNFAVVEYLAHEVAVMYLGRVVERGSTARVLAAPAHPYTEVLLSAVPRLDGRGRPIALAGETPSPAAPPAGCHFHPRCPRAVALCRERYPDLLPLADGRQVACHLPAASAVQLDGEG